MFTINFLLHQASIYDPLLKPADSTISLILISDHFVTNEVKFSYIDHFVTDELKYDHFVTFELYSDHFASDELKKINLQIDKASLQVLIFQRFYESLCINSA